MNLAMQIEIDNLKCDGCEKTIVKGLSAMPEVSELVVDRAQRPTHQSFDTWFGNQRECGCQRLWHVAGCNLPIRP